MAVEKSLTVRDYLEPRFAAAAGSRVAGTARKGLASFQQALKDQTSKASVDAAAGMKISEYFKNPVLKTQTARVPRMTPVANTAAAGPRSTETGEEIKTVKRAGLPESDQSIKRQQIKSGSRLARSTLQDFRSESNSGHPVEKSVQQAAAKYNLSPELIRGVIRAESNFQADAVSSAGAKGLMQLMPETARELGVSNPFDIQQNIDGGARYLRQMLDRFGGDLKRALAAYNAGPGAVEQFNGDVPYSETRQYVQRVLKYAGLKA
ncbi:MAG: lytic transglycosylase domain-containing protein [Desulfobacterales bacterium]|jgi:soluble lytic murein transglycosylase-like protein|nr:lytic transglycosylase domain-containing protein [Desulfobacterales bacterium]